MLIHCVPDAIAERTELTPEIESALLAWVAEMTGRGILLHGDRSGPHPTRPPSRSAAAIR